MGWYLIGDISPFCAPLLCRTESSGYDRGTHPGLHDIRYDWLSMKSVNLA